MSDPPKSRVITREMTRCSTCRGWWSTLDGDPSHCPCGGELVPTDVVEHAATLEYVPMKPPETKPE